MLPVFLALIVMDALLSAANPLLCRAIIDDGILPHRAGRNGLGRHPAVHGQDSSPA
jgi:hypothetical protein